MLIENIKGFDAQRAFQACIQSATYLKQKGIPYVLEQEYIPYERLGEATSIAMEYAIGDWGVAAMAQKLGDKEMFDLFLKGVNITSIILTRLFGLSDLKVLMGHGLLHMIRSFQYMEDMAFLVRVRVGNILFMFLNARLI